MKGCVREANIPYSKKFSQLPGLPLACSLNPLNNLDVIPGKLA
jgi:hypothetical protein